jgi:hypothetical protein
LARFGPIRPDIDLEDVALSFRMHLLGRISGVPELLVRYRIHGTNQSSFARAGFSPRALALSTERRRWQRFTVLARAYSGFEADLQAAAALGVVGPEDASALVTGIRKRRALFELAGAQEEARLAGRGEAFVRLARAGAPGRMLAGAGLRLLPRSAVLALKTLAYTLDRNA